MSDREQFEAARAAGLKARHETRVERAIRRQAEDKYRESDERWLNSCIWIDPHRQSGEPCFGGTRIPVDPFMAVAEEAGAEAAKAFWPNVTDAHIEAGKLWRARYTRRRIAKETS